MFIALENILRSFLSDYTSKAGEKLHVLVAVSGGVDSMALLNAAFKLRDGGDLDVTAAHLLHHPESTEAVKRQALVSDYCQRNRVDCIQSDLKGTPENGQSPEEWMREERYRFLLSTAQKKGCDYIVTGHHADDQAETVLARILTGAGISGLRGINARLDQVLRPFLPVRKSDLIGYCEAHGIPYSDDPMNEDTRYPRNFIRQNLLPLIRQELNPDVEGALNRLGAWSQEMEEILNFEADKGLRGARLNFQKGKIILDLNVLLTYFIGIRKFTILRALRLLAETPLNLTAQDYDHIERLIQTGRTGSYLEFPGGLELYRDRDRLVITNISLSDAEITLAPGRPGAIPEFDLKLSWGEPDWEQLKAGEAYEADLSFDSNPIKLRYAKEGDRFYPLGAPGEKRLFRFLTDQKVSRPEKRTTLVLQQGDRILWVIGHRISEYARVKRGVGSSWRLSFEPLEPSNSLV
ncbi:tRNA lysidine(34) synthetase TilS [bacterium]|nr:tRNA lysidine(34) synthetase TilS [bacterium]